LPLPKNQELRTDQYDILKQIISKYEYESDVRIRRFFHVVWKINFANHVSIKMVAKNPK
jgi:hypothetical protein